MNTFECPATVGGGCCAIGLGCASDLCFEYHYNTLVVLQPLSIQNSTSSIPQGSYDCIIPAAVSDMQTSIPPSDRILDAPKAWRAKIGEVAMRSQAEENWDGKNGNRMLRRLGCVVMGLLVITVVMLVF